MMCKDDSRGCGQCLDAAATAGGGRGRQGRAAEVAAIEGFIIWCDC